MADGGGDDRTPASAPTRTFWRAFGPGVLFAATAVGVSHLAQSTGAGITFGFGMLLVVVLANVFKYAAFEAGPRYAAATGESLVEGYRRVGRWALVLFGLMTIGTMFTIQAVVTIVGAALITGLTDPITGWGEAGAAHWSAIVTGVCVVILYLGRFPLLDKVIKALIAVLTLTTLVALISAMSSGTMPDAPWIATGLLSDAAVFGFAIAVAGWMPSAIDVSVWHSIWTLERQKQTRHRPTGRQSFLDFNIGYLGTALLALAFLALGALALYDPTVSFASAPGWANYLISGYAAQFGEWIRPIIYAAAIATMFSTTLAVIDSFPRVWQRLVWELQHWRSEAAEVDTRRAEQELSGRVYWIAMTAVSLGALALIYLQTYVESFHGRFGALINVATILSFLTAPILAYLNYRVVTGPFVPEADRPRRWLRVLSVVSIVVLAVFAVAYIVTLVDPAILFGTPAAG